MSKVKRVNFMQSILLTSGYLFLKLTPRTMKYLFRYRMKKVRREEGRRYVQGL